MPQLCYQLICSNEKYRTLRILLIFLHVICIWDGLYLTIFKCLTSGKSQNYKTWHYHLAMKRKCGVTTFSNRWYFSTRCIGTVRISRSLKLDLVSSLARVCSSCSKKVIISTSVTHSINKQINKQNNLLISNWSTNQSNWSINESISKSR